MTVVLLPAALIDVIRKGLADEIAWAAEIMRDAEDRIEAPEQSEGYRRSLHQMGALWALLEALGRATSPGDRRIDLDVHGWALIRAVTTWIPVQADMAAEIDQNDARRIQNREQPRRAAFLKETGALCQVALAIMQSQLETWRPWTVGEF